LFACPYKNDLIALTFIKARPNSDCYKRWFPAQPWDERAGGPISQEEVMRQRMLEALAYPRSFVMDNIDLRICPHDGIFELFCDHCQKCDLRQGCQWLGYLKKGEALNSEPTYTIHATLLFGLGLIEENNQSMQHDPEACSCESCTWARDAQQLDQEYRTLCLRDQFSSVYGATPV
jgi:hypothetical protein